MKTNSLPRRRFQPPVAEDFAIFAKRWMKTVMIYHKPSTQSSESSVINAHLLPAFGSFQVKEITAEVLQMWVSDQTASPKTIKNVVTTLKIMWITARAWGYVAHNPFEGPRLPTVVEGNTYPFNLEETVAIINEAQGWKKLFLWLLAETGARPGEAAGLRISDVSGRLIRVNQSVWKRQVQTPKTKAAVRPIPISTELAAAIKDHITRMAQGKATNPNGLLFPAKTGRALCMDNFRHRTLNPILDKLGIKTDKRCGLYALRHMNATLMDELAIPLKARQERLGHADPNVTLKNYTHPVDKDSLAAADQIGALLLSTSERESVTPETNRQQGIEALLCDSCRERLIAALSAGNGPIARGIALALQLSKRSEFAAS